MPMLAPSLFVISNLFWFFNRPAPELQWNHGCAILVYGIACGVAGYRWKSLSKT